MRLKIVNYAYYDNTSKMDKYNAPVLIFFCRDKDFNFHAVYVCDKENLAPEMYVEKKEWEKFCTLNIETMDGLPITSWCPGPTSNYGEETIKICTTFPWQVKKLRLMFSHTYLSDIKWEKMCVEKMGLTSPYIYIPDDFDTRWITVDEVLQLPESEHFYVPIKTIFWDIETNCYDEQTEILTKKGFIPFKNLTLNDDIATLNDGKLMWNKPIYIQKQQYIGNMIRIKSNTINLLVTPNHRIFSYKNNKTKFYKACESKKAFIPQQIIWQGKEQEWFYPPQINCNNCKQFDKIKMDDWLEFLGWYISEGCILQDEKYGYVIMISQTKEKNLKEIGNLLTRMGIKHNSCSNSFRFKNKQLWTYLKHLGKAHEKYIPQEFMDLSKRQLKILFTSLMKGDGYKQSVNIGYSTTSKKLADQVQEIILKIGYNSTLSLVKQKHSFIKNREINSNKIQYRIYVKKSKFCILRKEWYSKEDYNGMVYCCTVPTGIICVRRNGRPVWCGNSEPIFPNFNGYKDAENCDIISITAYDSYSKIYHRFYWHPKANVEKRESQWHRKGKYYVPSLQKEIEYDNKNKVIDHGFDNEIDMLKGYFDVYSEIRPDAQMGFNCYSDDTEILTKNSWKYFKDLTLEDEVATLNNGEIIWEKPLNIFEYKYKGNMIRINHNSTKLLITPNHKLYGAKSKTNKLYEAKEAMKFSNLSIPNKYDWKGTENEWFYPPKIEYSKYNSNGNEINKIKMDDWLEFLGWYISEGWCSNDNYSINRGYYRIGISQTKKENRKEIISLLKRIGIKPNISNKNQITFSNKQLWINLSKLGKAHEKYIPQEFINLSKRQLKILFDAMMKGDGTNYKGKKTYYTTSKKLADQVQEIVLKLGYNSSLHLKKRENKNWHDYYHVNIRKTKFNYLKPKHYSIESYKGKVYCCEVSSHILIVRKDGYPIACGNSEGGYKISTQKGYSRKYWFDGFDMTYLYHRCKTLGLLDDIQKMSPMPKKIKGVKWRASGDKHSVEIMGVCQIDFIYTNEIFGYHKKFDKFREGCYDNKTEILTKNGWKLFKDLIMDDEVACLSKDHVMYWHKPLAIQKYHYKGEMVKITHRSVDLLVTPNHKMYDCRNKHKKFKNAENFKSIHIPNTCDWNGEEQEWFYPPKIEYSKYTSHKNVFDKFLMDDWLEFLGWYIAEGSLYDKDYRVSIAQKKQKNFEQINDLLTRLGFNWKYNKQYMFNNKQLWTYLKPLGKSYEKYIPQELMNLSKRQLKILFNSLIKGDGWIYKNDVCYSTTSKKLADQFQELCIKIGYNSTKTKRFNIKEHELKGSIIKQKRPIYIIRIRKSNLSNINPKHYELNEYDGMVYCCTVPEHVILVRRKGRPVWCGNSLNGYMSFFLGFGKLDHSDEQIWEMWKNDSSSDYDPAGDDNGVKKQKNIIKELFDHAKSNN